MICSSYHLFFSVQNYEIMRTVNYEYRAGKTNKKSGLAGKMVTESLNALILFIYNP